MNTRFFFRNLLAATALLLIVFPVFSQMSAEDLGNERITHFHSEIHVQPNCKVRITETISVVSRGIQIHHGIYRDLPLYYDYQGGRTDVGFELLEVKLDGKTEDYHTKGLDNGIRIYMGSEDLVLEDGRYTFELTYEVEHVLGFFKDYDELYWNINGTGWLFPIDSLTAAISYPEGAGLKQFAGYTGSQGESGKDFTTEKRANGMFFATTRPLSAGENLTIAVAWEKNHLDYPSGFDNFIYWVKSHFLWIVAALGLLLTLLYNSRIWYRYGRDPKPGTIMPIYEAPAGFSPAEAAFLYNYGRRNKNMFTAQLIGLATKGRLMLHVEEGGMFSKKTYTITKKEPSAVGSKVSELLPLEETFDTQLFSYGDTIVFKQGTYQPLLKTLQDDLVEQVRAAQGETYILQRNRYKLRQYIIPAITLAVGLLSMLYFGGNLAIPLFGFVLCFAINIIFARLFEQPTAEGRKLLDELAGYKMYMQYADSERIRLMNPPTLDFAEFEKNLPYAIALGVAKEWSQKFDQAELQRAAASGHYWYTGAMIGSMHAFDFSDLSSTISSASTPPSKSSSGSGGGGFSGGGGGGGGGGGW